MLLLQFHKASLYCYTCYDHYIGLMVTTHEDHKSNVSTMRLPLRGLRALDQGLSAL